MGYGAALGTIALLFLLAVAIARALQSNKGAMPGAYLTSHDVWQVAQFVLALGLAAGCFAGAAVVLSLAGGRWWVPTLVFGAVFLIVGFVYAVTRPSEVYVATQVGGSTRLAWDPLAVLWAVELTALSAWLLFGVAAKTWAGRGAARPQTPPRWRWLPGWARVALGYLVGLALITPAIGPVALLVAGLGDALVEVGAILPNLLVASLLAAIVAWVAGTNGAVHGLLFGLLPASAVGRGLAGYEVGFPLGWSVSALGLIFAAEPLLVLLACWAGGALAAWLAGRKQLKPASG